MFTMKIVGTYVGDRYWWSCDRIVTTYLYINRLNQPITSLYLSVQSPQMLPEAGTCTVLCTVPTRT